MRWIWTLALACVIAATGVRPQLEIRDDRGHEIERAPTTLQLLTARAPAQSQFATRPHRLGVRDLRPTTLAILSRTGLPLAAPSARALSTAWALCTSLSAYLPAHPARGPPIA